MVDTSWMHGKKPQYIKCGKDWIAYIPGNYAAGRGRNPKAAWRDMVHANTQSRKASSNGGGK